MASKETFDAGGAAGRDESEDEPAFVSTEYDISKEHGGHLERSLKSRHLQFLALGGSIGTGLFVGSGAILADTGPAPLFMGYLSMSLVVWCVMNVLAEMATAFCMRGVTVPYFVGRFVDPSLAFADGYNYLYAYIFLLAAEASACGIIVDYWNPPVNVGVWIAIVLAVVLFLNIVAVGYYGEAEFWFASIKIITLCGLIIVGIVIFFGGGPNQDGIRGFHYWNNPGAFKDYQGSHFLAYWHAFIAAGFAFITSPELIAIAAGETVAPRRNIPKAARRFVARLVFFYGCSSLLIGILVSSDNSRLLNGASDASASPFVIGISQVGIPVLNHIINAAILTSAWSAGNSFLYSGSRILYTLATTGNAPGVFARTNRKGVPYVAVLATWSVSLLAFLNVSNDGAKVFGWFVNISTISGYIGWIVALVTYLRFRKALVYNGLLHTLPYRTPFQPYFTWFTLLLVSLLTLTNAFQVFTKGNWDVDTFLTGYITLPIFLALYLGHKFIIRAKQPWYRKVNEIDVVSGMKEMDELTARDKPRVPKNFAQRMWFWVV